MVKVKFDRTQIKETDKDKNVKVNFAGSVNGVCYSLSVSGDADDIQAFLDNLKITKYGQYIEIGLSNSQSSLNDFWFTKWKVI